MSCEKTTGHSFSLIHHPAQAGSPCLCRGSSGVSQVYHFEYDNFDNTTSISVGANEEYTLASYVYAAKNGLLTTQTYGNGDNVSFTYDILGRTKTATYKDIDGNTDRVLTYVYTGDGQLYSIHDSSTGYTYLYTYDNIGRLIASCVKLNTTVLMSTRREYDTHNQLIAQHWTVDGTTYSETYTYSKTDGALTSYNNALGQTLTYNYDALRRLSSISGGVYERLYSYKDASATNTTSLVSNYHYKDTDGELVYSFYYTYDELGNITGSSGTGGVKSYTYDAQSQLEKAVIGSTTYEYTYDDAGNILTASGKSYSYDNTVWQDLLTAYDNQPIAYEGQVFSNGAVTGTPVSGNPISYYNGTRWTFDWEEVRNLVSATSGSNNYTYAYDQNGLRVSKEENGKTHTYLYASGKLLRETISYTENGEEVVEILDFIYDQSGNPFALNYTADGTTACYYYITNLQGDVLAMVTGNGTSVASYAYDPYGKVLSATGTMASINPLRYRGYYYDAETGFYYLQSRYYDPTICRFINADSYASTGQGIVGNNMFAYCNNNPIMYKDSLGCWPFQAIFELFDTWLFGDGTTQRYTEGDRVVRNLKKSEKMQNLIDTAIENYKEGQPTTSDTVTFTADEDGYEMYLSIGECSYTMSVTEETRTSGFGCFKHEEVRYIVTVEVRDPYNFETFDSWDSIGHIANNIALIYSILGGGNDYEWYATYTYSTKWTDVA